MLVMCSLPYCCCGRARRRLRQWHVPGWLAGYDAIHAVFPLFVDRPEMLGIMAVMEQRGFHALVVVSGSGMWFCVACCVPWSIWTRRTVMHCVGFTGDDAPRAVLLFLAAPCLTFSVWPFVERCVAEEAATAAFDASARTADRRHGARCSPASRPCCGAWEKRRPTGTEDSELREAPWCPDGARGAGGSSRGRLRGCLRAAPLRTDAGGHCG